MSEGCSAVKRFGESCPRNNNCKYPQCLIDEHTEAWKGLEEENKALQKRVEELESEIEYCGVVAESNEVKEVCTYLLNKIKSQVNEPK